MLGMISGAMSGLFSVGGSFVGIPILVGYGIESAVVVSSFTHQMLTTSFVNVAQDIEQKKINFKLVFLTLIGGLWGVLQGIFIFKKLTLNGQIDIVISCLYIFVLGFIAIFMMYESCSTIKNKYCKTPTPTNSNKNAGKESQIRRNEKNFIQKIDVFPFKIRINNNASISIFLIIFFGLIAGTLVAVAGIANGLLMVPVMLYVYKMQIRNAMATSNLHGGILVLVSVMMQSLTFKSTDLVLSMLLLVGATTGMLITRTFAHKIPAEELRLLFALIMLVVIIKIVFNIALEPKNIYNISIMH